MSYDYNMYIRYICVRNLVRVPWTHYPLQNHLYFIVLEFELGFILAWAETYREDRFLYTGEKAETISHRL